MKLVRASYKILTDINGEEILKAVEQAARTCYQSEGKIEIGHRASNGELYDLEAISARVLIPKLMNRGHFAMLEFGGMITVRFIVDRGVSHELVRHRLCSFAQESTRYCNYGKDEHITFIIPPWLEIEECETRSITQTWVWCKQPIDIGVSVWLGSMIESESNYNSLLSKGWSPQQARSVLPNSLKTEINMSANIREWREIFKQRVALTAHPQMREVMQPLLDKFKSKIPILFDDIIYEKSN